MKKGKKVLTTICFILIVLVVFWVVVGQIEPYQVTDYNPWRSERTLISAHRGGANLNPENTKMAFDHVIIDTDYTDVIELDVRLTRDDELVIIHDASINRTGIAQEMEAEEVLIRNSSFDELYDYNLGINFRIDEDRPYSDTDGLASDIRDDLRIMRLSDFFYCYEGVRDIKLLLEIKDTKEDGVLAADVAEAMLNDNEWWSERTMIISFSTDVINHMIEYYPERYIAGMGYNMVPFLIGSVLGLDSLFKIKYQSIQTSMITKAGPIEINCATQQFVDSAHRRNQCVAYWTINDVSDMKHLIGLGADIITTNSPDLLYDVILGKI